jgi:hypothetical protein
MKRKNESSSASTSPVKKRALPDQDAQARFRDGLFAPGVLEQYTQDYANSEPLGLSKLPEEEDQH